VLVVPSDSVISGFTPGIRRRPAELTSFGLALTFAAAGALACSSELDSKNDGDPSDPNDPNHPGAVSFSCNPEELPSVTPLRRISRVEYETALSGLFAAGRLPEVVVAAAPEIAQLPPDGENANVFTRMDSRVLQRHVDGYYAVADSIARSVTSDTELLGLLAGSCASEASLAETCVSTFVSSFGRQLFRRPLSAEELARYMELFDAANPAETFRGLVLTLLMAPQFLYQFEVAGTAIGSNPRHLKLSGFEIASRLSAHFWQAPPDEALLIAAETGALDSDTGYQAEVERVFSDPRTQENLWRLWSEWQGLEQFDGFTNTPAFYAFATGVDATLDLYGDMVAETRTLVDRLTWQTAGTLPELFTNNQVLTQSPALATLYGVSPWDGSSEPAVFPAGQRAGLLTRAALLLSGSEITNPIKRGAFVLKRLLCHELEPPSNLPPDALALPAIDPAMSTRARFHAKTSPDDCNICHAQFNPFGFVLESYDGLGRFRTEETVYADSGDVLATVPVDPVVEVTLDGTAIPMNNAAEFSEALASSTELEECFTRQYFRYAYRRDEAPGDSCALGSVHELVSQGRPLSEALRAVALAPAFRERVVGE
jgi:hypothetical protein